MKIKENLADWYKGKYIPPDNSPNSVGTFLMSHYERHWTSRFLHGGIDFYLKEWKWLLGTVLALLAIYTNYALKH
jgi:hypothetical protein